MEVNFVSSGFEILFGVTLKKLDKIRPGGE